MTRVKSGAVLIAGPTAGGKSTLALALAERVGGVIVNADSMQVYRELRTLTARPSAADEVKVPHRLYGTVSARETYSVGRWTLDARAAIAEASAAGRVPIVVGGTGLYLAALTEGLADVPPIPAAIRGAVRARLAAEGAPALHAELLKRDPVIAARLRPSDPQRIARALEVLEATGRSLATFQTATAAPGLDIAARVVVAPPRTGLYAAIDARFNAMLAEGALEEVSAIAALDLPADAPARRALGVEPLLAHLDGRMSLEEAMAAAKLASRHYAKRQLTWVRNKMIAWNWLEEKFSERNLDTIFSLIADIS